MLSRIEACLIHNQLPENLHQLETLSNLSAVPSTEPVISFALSEGGCSCWLYRLFKSFLAFDFLRLILSVAPSPSLFTFSFRFSLSLSLLCPDFHLQERPKHKRWFCIFTSPNIKATCSILEKVAQLQRHTQNANNIALYRRSDEKLTPENSWAAVPSALQIPTFLGHSWGKQ